MTAQEFWTNYAAASDKTSDLLNWAEFNRLKWGCPYVIRRFQSGDSDYYGEAIFFEGKRGKWYLPPLNAYHFISFCSGAASKAHKQSSRWHETAELMIGDFKANMGTAGIVFPPDITDMRPFLWAGFQVGIKYTYQLKLPFVLGDASSEIRGKIRKAAGMGYRTELTARMADVAACLDETESRKGFSHQLTKEDLELARELLGDKALRCYVCYAPDGEPASASVVLALDNGMTLGWVAGSKSAHLSSGVVQFSQSFVFEDLSRLGCTSFDFAGANIPAVAKSKAPWGAELVPYYFIRRPSLKGILRSGYDWGSSRMKLS
ncbi:GNAT family N-acetyltransferase [Paenibacillus pinistramenti]|uniref:GNAT family N-acetyltransferase n=1 Tax=Paenibacillus pinistramenti TaxID=1768003 RepID=UPI001109667A|nr:GNAT family N-acetyltransferase [Paenibacillus pinistramenti]